MAMTDFTIIRRSLTARLFSTLMTTLMVATAVALMLVLLSMRDSGRKAFERGSGNMHMLISKDASPLVAVLNSVFYANPPRNPIPMTKVEEIRKSFPLEWVVPVQQGDSYRGFPVLASTTDFFDKYQPDLNGTWEFAEGRAFTTVFEVVVGSAVARATGLQIGDEIFLTHGIETSRGAMDDDAITPHVHRDFTYVIVGILEPTGGPHDRALFTDLDSTWIIHAHDRRLRDDSSITTTTVDDLVEADRLVTGMYIKVISRRGRGMSGAQQQVFDMLRRDTTITVADPNQQVASLFRIVGNIDDILLAMAVVVMISSGIAIMLALYNSMEQRRRQIAVLRVLGCSQGRVFGLIVTESAIIGVAGVVFGLGLAYVGATTVASVMKSRLGLVIEPNLPLQPTAVLSLATIFLAAAAGIIPAVMAYRTAVVRNLRPIG